MWWHHLKGPIGDWIGLPNEALHTHLGLAIFCLGIVIFRRSAHPLGYAWFALFGLQCLNEALDATDWLRWTGEINIRETARDFLHTLLWPSLATLVLPRMIDHIKRSDAGHPVRSRTDETR